MPLRPTSSDSLPFSLLGGLPSMSCQAATPDCWLCPPWPSKLSFVFFPDPGPPPLSRSLTLSLSICHSLTRSFTYDLPSTPHYSHPWSAFLCTSSLSFSRPLLFASSPALLSHPWSPAVSLFFLSSTPSFSPKNPKRCPLHLESFPWPVSFSSSTIIPVSFTQSAPSKMPKTWDAASHEALILALVDEMRPSKQLMEAVALRMTEWGFSCSQNGIK